MIRWGQSLGREVLVVATKLDKLSRTRRGAQLDQIASQLGQPAIAFSAREHFGVDELWHAMVSS